MVNERTLVLIKHDGVIRNLVGKIISRFEDIGLKLVGMKMVWADDGFARKHYQLDEQWAKNIYDKTKAGYDREGKKFPYKNAMDLGKTIQKWNAEFLQEGPVLAMVIEGPHAIEIVRKIVGSTEPRSSAPGTIRGDFAMIESYAIADEKKRVLRNLVHASDSLENAKREIALWFTEKEIYKYSKEMDKHL